MALNEHITDEIFDRYAQRGAASEENLRVQTHTAVCDICRAKLGRVVNAERAFAAVRRNFAFDAAADAPEHLAYEQLEFFVDDKMDAVDREIAESHLAICDECAQDLENLLLFRKISATPAPIAAATTEASQQGFWKKFFIFGSIGGLAGAAAVILVAALLGTWLILRDSSTNEIAENDKNQNAVPSNYTPVNSTLANGAPETVQSPEVTPSIEVGAKSETLYALNDGHLTVDEKGNVKGAENLSPAAQSAIKQSLLSGKLSIANHSLGGGGGVLMSGDAGNGIPFGLQTPLGKVVKEAQPVLRWKSLKDAQNYSVAIVDDKFRVVEQSGNLTGTSWKPSKPLPRGANYSWQVTATLADGTETVSPSSPAPQARFRVIEHNLFDDINRLEKSGDSSHLALGVLYAKAGLKREARAEFEKLVKENPNSDVARKLLQSVK